MSCFGVDAKRSEAQNHTYSALSRYGLTGNGGSFKAGTNIHYGTPIPHNRPSTDMQFCQQESEMSLLRCELGRCVKADPHCVSISSQSTILTTMSNNGANRSLSAERSKQSNGRSVYRSSDSLGSRGSLRTGGVPLENGEPGGRLSTIAEKLRRGTKKVLQFSKSPPTSPTKVSTGVQTSDRDDKRRWLRKKESVDSVDTNTISNSSLKEYDEEEFSSAELARFMAEINNEIRWMRFCESYFFKAQNVLFLKKGRNNETRIITSTNSKWNNAKVISWCKAPTHMAQEKRCYLFGTMISRVLQILYLHFGSIAMQIIYFELEDGSYRAHLRPI